jgi:hypothetical protein
MNELLEMHIDYYYADDTDKFFNHGTFPEMLAMARKSDCSWCIIRNGQKIAYSKQFPLVKRLLDDHWERAAIRD